MGGINVRNAPYHFPVSGFNILTKKEKGGEKRKKEGKRDERRKKKEERKKERKKKERRRKKGNGACRINVEDSKATLLMHFLMIKTNKRANC